MWDTEETNSQKEGINSTLSNTVAKGGDCHKGFFKTIKLYAIQSIPETHLDSETKQVETTRIQMIYPSATERELKRYTDIRQNTL